MKSAFILPFVLAVLVPAAFLTCGGPKTIPLPPGGPEALPAEVLLKAGRGVQLEESNEILGLEMVGTFYALSNEIGETLWPGWPWPGMAFGLWTAPDRWLLVNHDDAPPGMQVAAQELLPCPVYAGPMPGEIDQESCIAYRGRSLAVLRLDERAPAKEVAGDAFLLIRLFQGSFFLFREIHHPLPEGLASSAAGGPYPPFLDPFNNLLGRAEAMALEEALETGDSTISLDAAACFLTLRRIRRAHLDRRVIALEQRWEQREGLACYTGLKAIELARDAEQNGWEGHRLREGALPIDYGTVAGSLEILRKSLLALAGWSGYLNGSSVFMTTGMAQAYLLDRLFPGWKTAYLAGEAPPLDTLLETLLE
jgi:hypothetical protein